MMIFMSQCQNSSGQGGWAHRYCAFNLLHLESSLTPAFIIFHLGQRRSDEVILLLVSNLTIISGEVMVRSFELARSHRHVSILAGWFKPLLSSSLLSILESLIHPGNKHAHHVKTFVKQLVATVVYILVLLPYHCRLQSVWSVERAGVMEREMWSVECRLQCIAIGRKESSRQRFSETLSRVAFSKMEGRFNARTQLCHIQIWPTKI